MTKDNKGQLNAHVIDYRIHKIEKLCKELGLK